MHIVFTALKADSKRMLARFAELYHTDQVNMFAEQFTEDCIYMPPDHELLHGKEGEYKSFKVALFEYSNVCAKSYLHL